MQLFLNSAAMFYPLCFGCLLLLFCIVFLRSLPVVAGVFKDIPQATWVYLAGITVAGLVLRWQFSVRTNLDAYSWQYLKDAVLIKGIFYSPLIVYKGLINACHIPGYAVLLSFFPITSSLGIIAVSVFNIAISVFNIPLVFLTTYYYTRDKFAALLASALLAFSWLHIHYSGYEFPMPISVFLTTLSFLYLLVWLKKKDKASGAAFVALFFISVNIKFENIVLLGLFIPLLAVRMKRDIEFKRQAVDFIKIFFPLAVIFLLVFFRYLENLSGIQHLKINRGLFPGEQIFSLAAFWKHFEFFFVERYRGALFLLTYLCLRLDKKLSETIDIIFWWALTYIPLFSYFALVNSEWNMMQIIVPVYILGGAVLAILARILLKNDRRMYFLPLCLSVLLALSVYNNRHILKGSEISWVDLKSRLANVGKPEDCFVTYDIQTLKFSLPYISGKGINWIFYNFSGSDDKIKSCRGTVYFFNPVPYGLQEEEDQFKVESWDQALRRRYQLKKISDIELYKLREKVNDNPVDQLN